MHSKLHALCTFGVALALLLPSTAEATDFHVDPATGSASNDGSAGKPWKTIQEVVQGGLLGSAVKAGDTLLLRTGYHGEIVINGGNYATPLTIAAAAGQVPQVRTVKISGTTGLVLRGLSISPSHAPTYAKATLVTLTGSKISVENCQVFSVPNASSWSADDWVNQASSGFEVGGDGNIVRGNTVRNVRFGINVGGANALIERNTVENFSADGMRGLGNGGTYQYNVIKNAYVGDPPDTNHDDGFQSWSVGPGGVGTGEVVGVVLRGNLIMNYEDPNQPFRTTLQGIGNFDGTFVDWVIENNVVITDHWHGITLLGARNCRVVNNTVIDRNTATPGPPWIQIGAHKDGTAPEGCLVRNNLTTDLNLAGSGVTQDHNIELSDLASMFKNPAAFDLHLLPSAPAVNQGSADQAPATDIEGVPRPQGAGVDIGAYEWHDGSVVVDAGVGATGGSAGPGGGSAGTSGSSAGIGGSSAGSSSGGSSDSTGGRAGTTGHASGEADVDGGCGCYIGSRASGAAWLAAITALALIAGRLRRPA